MCVCGGGGYACVTHYEATIISLSCSTSEPSRKSINTNDG